MIDIALKNVFRQKVRSLLTMLGIAMGIGLILTLGSIGEGLNRQIDEQFGNMAAVIDVRSMSGDGIEEELILDIGDIDGVEKAIPIGEYRITQGGRRFGGMMGRMMGGSSSSGIVEFTAISPEDQDYLIGEAIVAGQGRKLDPTDDGDFVLLVGYTAAENQYLNVGDEIEYERTENNSRETFSFEVVGILEETGDDTVDGAAYVPLQTMQELEDDDTISRLKVKLSDIEKVEDITDDINQMDDSIRAFSALTIVRTLESTLGTITMAVYGIGAVSIIVGGIGIMNTMIMSVMERRREIGVMKAIGATTTNILTQVLEESAVLSLIGGGIGVLLGYVAVDMVASNTDFSPVLSPMLLAVGLGFSLVLGMGAGLYPAYAASRLDPIEVLRYE